MSKGQDVVFMVLLALLSVLQQMWGPAPQMTLWEMWEQMRR